jgi:indolepyruvate ferredoxin oxidoreductase beta subunit
MTSVPRQSQDPAPAQGPWQTAAPTCEYLAAGGSLLLVGVGGQGVVLASAIIADAALRSGYDVKQSEVHGMSQRGGVVSSHLRFGPEVHSPLVEPGRCDALVALEWNEALRALPYLRPGAPLIVNLQRMVPPGDCRDRKGGQSTYPPMAVDLLAGRVGDLRACDATAIATQVGSPKAANSVLLGVLAPLLPFADEAWRDALEANVPRGTFPANQRAFQAGRALRYPAETRRQAAAHARPTHPGTANGRHAAAVRVPRVEVTEHWCKGRACEICVRVCPEYVLAIDAADRVAVVRPDACTACRLCELLCPDFAIAVHDAWRDRTDDPHPAGQAVTPSPTSGVPSPTSGVPSPTSRVPSPTSRVPSPTSRVPSPTSRVPSPSGRGSG